MLGLWVVEKHLTNKPTCDVTLSQMISFTSDILMSFKAFCGNFHVRSNLSKSVTHTHETLLNDDQVSVILGILIASCELEADDILKTILESLIREHLHEIELDHL